MKNFALRIVSLKNTRNHFWLLGYLGVKLVAIDIHLEATEIQKHT